MSWHFWWVTQLMDCSVSCELLIFLRYSSIIFVCIAIFFSAFSNVPFMWPSLDGSNWIRNIVNMNDYTNNFQARKILFILSHANNLIFCNTYRITTFMAIFFSFDIIEIDLFDECIIIVNTEFFKKWFSNLVDIANYDWRKKYFCQGNCHCVNCCNNLWKSKMWLMFNAFKKSFTFITSL